MRPSRSELVRKLGHVAFGAGAFLIRPLGWPGGAAIALAGLLFNLFLLSRIGGRAIWRRHEAEQGFAAGIVLYPLTILVLILTCWRRPEVAAAAWGIVAFGDGLAALAGGAGIGPRLPWNPDKSWAGSAVFVVAGALAAATLIWWTAPGKYDAPFLLAAASLTALFAAWVESQPQRLDDNLTVPLLAALFLFCLLEGANGWPALCSQMAMGRLAIGLLVSVALGVVALAAGAVSASGLMSGSLFGALIWAAASWRGYLLMAAFVVLASGATTIGSHEKEVAGVAQANGGRRRARHALAKLSVPAATAVFALITPHAAVFRLAFVGALASVAADTVATEIGQAFGRRTVLLATLRRAARGTVGAISLEGTSAGLGAAFVVAGLAGALRFVPWMSVIPLTLAGFVATLIESLVGATLGNRGLLDHEATNFLESLIGALLAAAAAYLPAL